MKAWVITKAGKPEDVLEQTSPQLPAPGRGEICVKVLAAGVGLPDLLMCREQYEFKPPRPFTPGQEVCGIITDANGIEGVHVGRRVMGVTAFFNNGGGFAEEALMVADTAMTVPESMPDTEAAVFSIPYRTAFLALVTRGRLQEGETLLVQGASGGTGFAAVQLGKALGANVIAVAGGEEKTAACLKNGADHAIDSKKYDFLEQVNEITEGRGVDVVFDLVGGDVFSRSLNCLSYGGRMLAVGFASGSWADASTHQLVMQNISVVGVLAISPSAEVAGKMESHLLRYYTEGKIKPQIWRSLDFDALPQALQDLAERKVAGKQVVRVG